MLIVNCFAHLEYEHLVKHLKMDSLGVADRFLDSQVQHLTPGEPDKQFLIGDTGLLEIPPDMAESIHVLTGVPASMA